MNLVSVARRDTRWVIVAGFVAVELWQILARLTGPFYDESIYIVAGLRTLRGYGFDDNYLSWFSGSLLWPIFAGLGFSLGGLQGARIFALFFSTITLIAMMLTTETLYGRRASFFAGLLYAISGPVLALGFFAVYDQPALAAVAVCLWALTRLKREDHRKWLVVAAMTFSLSYLSKYPIVLMIVPILGVIWSFRSNKALLDVAIFTFISVGIGMIFFMPLREQLSDWLTFMLGSNWNFGSTRESIAFAQLVFEVIPIILATGGLVLSKDKPLSSVLFLTIFLWPAYHILSGNPVSDHKHAVFGFVFAFPLIGLLLARLWEEIDGRIWVCLIMAVSVEAGLLEVNLLNGAWPDVRAPAEYLTSQVRPTDRLLINDSWPYAMYLIGAGKVDSPWSIYDPSRLSEDLVHPNFCSFDWFVDEEGSFSWSEEVRKTIEACPGFEKVQTDTVNVTGLGKDLNFVTYPVKTVIWQNKLRR
jgi:hypothetical protein